jgi:hypothetical protein
MDIYRSVKAEPDTTNKLHVPKTTMRPPGNVPYVVDNLWEWKRPKKYPNRRCSVFANPDPETAKKSGSTGGTVFRVEFKGEFKLCQLKDIEDSKYHPECDSLKKLLLKHVGTDWPNRKLEEKVNLGRLWMPCITKDEMNYLFGSVEQLRKIRDEVFNAIRYWEDVVLVAKDAAVPYRFAELFFEARDGYYLRRVD